MTGLMRSVRAPKRAGAPVDLMPIMPSLHLITRRRLAFAAAMWTVPALWAGVSLAQPVRDFPYEVEHGNITFDAPRRVLIGGVSEHLEHGVQVRNENNRSLHWNQLRGKTLAAHYVRNASGAIVRIWLLNPQERAQPAQRHRVEEKKRATRRRR